MNSKGNIISKPKTRSEFNDPYIGVPMQDRLKMGNVTNLKNNHTLERVNSKYSKIKAIDNTKKY